MLHTTHVGGIGPPPPFRQAAARQREDPYARHCSIKTAIEVALGNTIDENVQAAPGLARVRDEVTGELVTEEGELVLEYASPR